MTKISFLNGQFLPHEKCFVHIEDRGLQFADSIYEVILFYDNHLIDADGHFARLFRSLREMRIEFDKNEDELRTIILQLFKKNNLQNGSVYLQITRGTAPRNAGLPECQANIMAVIKPPFENQSQNIKVITHPDIRWGRCDIKSTALIAGSLAKQKAVDEGFDDVILIKDNLISESSFANFFMVDDEENLITPDIHQNILCGITRNRIIDLAKENNINVIEKKIDIKELENVKEAFLTSSTLLIRPIIKIDQNIISEGKIGNITQKLSNLYQQFLDNH